MINRFIYLLGVVFFAALVVPNGVVRAADIWVGPQDNCNFPTIQAAINQANSQIGFDTIHVAHMNDEQGNQVGYLQQALVIDTNENLMIRGGYSSCSGSAGGAPTIVDGRGGAAAPVMTIRVNAAATVFLNN